MSHKSKDNEFKFSGKLIFRWLIFIAVIYFGFIYFSSQSPSVLGDTTQINLQPIVDNLVTKLPPQSQEYINNFESTPLSQFIKEKSAVITDNLNGFPDKQIKDIKKTVVKSIYDDLIKSIEKN